MNIDALALMLRSRYFENVVEDLFNKKLCYGTTHLATGQEASQAGLCMNLSKDDWIVSTHRCHGYAICKGTEAFPLFSELFGSKYGSSKGLTGSMHFQDPSVGNGGSSAIVGSGIPLATGIAFYLKQKKQKNISVAIFGDGATSRGTLHECMNLSSIWNLPLLFFCENNFYGMSASSSRMISTTSIASRSTGYNIEYETVDGNDFDAVFDAVKKAKVYILENQRPYFIEVQTYRQKGHSKNDQRLYRSKEEELFWLNKDPISLYEKKLIESGISPDQISKIKKQEETYINKALDEAIKHKDEILSQEEALDLVYTKDCLPTEKAKDVFTGEITYKDAIKLALKDNFATNNDCMLIGEDIGLYGGCFKVTGDLYSNFDDQILETPVSEESFTGMAVAAARMGLRPIIEIMYADFATLISDPLINHAAKTHFMSGGISNCPLTIRFPSGPGTGHGAQHTQSPENMFLNTPGLVVVSPSNAQDAYQMLRMSVNNNNPVLFFEAKALYNEMGYVDNQEDFYDLTKAKVVKEGSDLTIISYGLSMKHVLEATRQLSEDGIMVEVIDLRCLKPIDKETILESVRKTGLALVVQATNSEVSVASEVLSIICEDNKTFSKLKGPLRRLSCQETPTPFTRELEELYIPSVNQIKECVRQMLNRD